MLKKEEITMSHYDDEVRRISKGKTTIDDAKRINKEKGRHWFSPDTMRFFKSRIEKKALTFGQLIDDKYFITSEQYDSGSPRLYSVRVFNKKTGAVKTVGDFQEFGTKAKARKFAWCLADHNGDVEACRKRK